MTITVWLSIATCLTAATTCLITLLNFLKNRPRIKCRQIDPAMSHVFKPDRLDTENPDVYWQSDYRVIFDVIISNESSSPISIIEFKLNEKMIFNSFSRIGNEYKITTDTGQKKVQGVVFSTGSARSITVTTENSTLQPIINLAPNSAVRGFIVFRTNDKADLTTNKNLLLIRTTRKTFRTNLKLGEYFESCLPLPDTVVSARNQKF